MGFSKRIAVLTMLVCLAGCGAWKPDKLQVATAAQIDSRLSPGMPLSDFKGEFPDAVLLEGSDESGAWLASARDVCFWCTTPRGFQHSTDVYVRVVYFENGRLQRIEAAEVAGHGD